MNLKIYIDTNIFINSILNRDESISQDILIFLNNNDRVNTFFNDVTIINIDYIIKKYIDKEIIKEELRVINSQHTLVCADSKIIDQALDSKLRDFEDAVQYFCAKSIEADAIITDNIKDFQNLDIEVMSAKEFFYRFIQQKSYLI
ncbi:PIN domain protein [hydrothermal vent metagenome]|uniref:PIN domain protein n=1 Tax=hydrothermal vent metagenome TaxID=652676 RepID=A0A1W1B8L8_9ZZZZ